LNTVRLFDTGDIYRLFGTGDT